MQILFHKLELVVVDGPTLEIIVAPTRAGQTLETIEGATEATETKISTYD